MGVSVVVVTYNRLQLLKQCLKTLLNQTYKVDNIFVVNNKSTDGTTKFLNNINNNVIKPINMTNNLGGAGGFSIGTKIAFEKSNSDYFWLMDDDSLPTKSALLFLTNAAHKLNGHFGYLCSNVRWWKTGAPSYLNVPIVSKDWNESLNKGLVKTKSASFVSLFVPRKRVKELGLPIADMFIWGDDVEYTTRLSRKYPSYLVSDSIVMHKSKANSTNESVLDVPMNRLIYYKCMFRNRLYISRKYYKFTVTIKLLASYLFYLMKIPIYSKNHRLKRFEYTISGIINGFLFKPRIKFPEMRK